MIRLQVPRSLAPDRFNRDSQICLLPITTIVTVEANSPLIKFHTQVTNTARDHRLRVLFPTGIHTPVSHAETQFDVVTRQIIPARYDDSTIPENVKQVIIGAREPEPVTIFPQRAFVDLNDGMHGLALLNQGLPEYEILPTHNTIALTLLRGVGWIARPDLLTRIGDAGPLIAVPGAQCLRKMAFDYAVLVHAGDWQAGQVVQQADQFNSRQLIVETGAHPGQLADCASFLRLDDPSGQLKVTAIKRSENGRAWVVRFYNPTLAQLSARIWSSFWILRAGYANLAEEPKGAINLEDHHILPVLAGPKKIVTVWLEIEPAGNLLTPTSPEITLQASGADDENNYSGIDPPQSISAEELARESQRAAELETTLVDKEHLLQDFLSLGTPADALGVLKMYQLKLDVAAHRRTALEARLSETLLLKNYWKMQSGGQTGLSASPANFEANLRQIGYAINNARVEKRALEYVVDYYSKQIS